MFVFSLETFSLFLDNSVWVVEISCHELLIRQCLCLHCFDESDSADLACAIT